MRQPPPRIGNYNPPPQSQGNHWSGGGGSGSHGSMGGLRISDDCPIHGSGGGRPNPDCPIHGSGKGGMRQPPPSPPRIGNYNPPPQSQGNQSSRGSVVPVMFGGGGIPCGGVYVGLIGGRGATLTCNHVAENGIISAGGSPQLEVTNDKYGYDMVVVFTQPLSVPAISIGSPPTSGERLTITGFPMGRFGVHSGDYAGRAAPLSGQSWGDIIIGVASQGGDSGGAVTNSRGELVGILWGTASNGGPRSMAVPTEAIVDFLRRLKEKYENGTGSGQEFSSDQPWNNPVEEIPPSLPIPPIDDIKIVEESNRDAEDLKSKIDKLVREVEILRGLCDGCADKLELSAINEKIEGNAKVIKGLVLGTPSVEDWEPKIDANRKAIEELAGRCYSGEDLVNKIEANTEAIRLLLDTPIRLQIVKFDPKKSSASDLMDRIKSIEPGDVIQESVGYLGGAPLRLEQVPVGE
jgi:hypothetical protein